MHQAEATYYILMLHFGVHDDAGGDLPRGRGKWRRFSVKQKATELKQNKSCRGKAIGVRGSDQGGGARFLRYRGAEEDVGGRGGDGGRPCVIRLDSPRRAGPPHKAPRVMFCWASQNITSCRPCSQGAAAAWSRGSSHKTPRAMFSWQNITFLPLVPRSRRRLALTTFEACENARSGSAELPGTLSMWRANGAR